MTDDERRELGQKIKTARKSKGLSQEQLADLVGYKVGTISKYEQGYRIPDIGMLKKISAELECNVADLVGNLEEALKDEVQFEEAIQGYVTWLRGVDIMLTTPSYEEKDGKEKIAFIVDIDGIPLDIGDNLDVIMQMGKEHFKLLAKQFGKCIYDT